MAQEIFHETFPNGLTLLAERMKQVRSAALNFLVPAGCAYDPPQNLGIASEATAAAGGTAEPHVGVECGAIQHALDRGLQRIVDLGVETIGRRRVAEEADRDRHPGGDQLFSLGHLGMFPLRGGSKTPAPSNDASM